MLNAYWILASVFAGFLTFLSPCVLPVLPIVLSTSIGKSPLRPLWIVSGLVLSFTLLGISINFLGSFLGINPQQIRWIALSLLLFAGLLFLFPEWSAKLFQPLIQRFGNSRSQSESPLACLGIGASLGAIWTPCAGPIFAVVLSAALIQKNFLHSSILIFAYAIGAGIPMLGAAYLGNRLIGKVRGIARLENKIRRFSGALLIVGVVLFGLGLDTRLVAALPVTWFNFAPVEAKLVDQLQDSPPVNSAPQAPAQDKNVLPDLGPAPQIAETEHWLNSAPLNLESLKGKVVLVDFWTYSCINCLRTLPYLKKWDQTYRNQGLVIVGVHAPEFAFEKDLQNVSKAVKNLGIAYPVALDNNYSTWKNFDNHYWPAHYLIDAKGVLRYQHHGEGEYENTEAAIQSLLKEKGAAVKTSLPSEISATVDFSRIESPETYVGYDRMERFNSQESVLKNAVKNYSLSSSQALNTWSLQGAWQIEAEKSRNKDPQAKLRFKFKARKLNLVMAPSNGVLTEAIVKLDGKVVDAMNSGQDVREGKVRVTEPRLYELIDLKEVRGEHLFEIEFVSPGTEVFAFTFG